MSESGDWTRAVRDAAARMENFGAPWCVGGGWAADLYLGRATRPHADVDLVILRGDEGRLPAQLPGWTFRLAVGGRLIDWDPREPIRPPVHEIHARSPDGAALEFLLNDHDDARWIYRRDPAVRCPLGEVIVRTGAGVPILCPAVVLLYKSKAPRQADEHDLHHLLPALPARQRRWLRDALAAAHPGHPWQALL
jgi:hypothetical protein